MFYSCIYYINITKNHILKKPSLNQEELKNYRPVSNIHFLSKIIENL